MRTRIGTIISYCTNDYRFIGKCIEEAKRFSDQILIAVCDHLFDGTGENRHLLHHTYQNHPDCQFLQFAYQTDRIYSNCHSIAPNDPDWAIYWAATTRYIGFHWLKPQIEWVLFLDSDEILEGESFLQWIEAKEHLPYEAMRLGSYYYGLKATARAKKVVNLPLFVQKGPFSPLTLFNELERIGAYQSHRGPKREEVLGLAGLPMVHHYSWTRTKEECLRKGATWSHRNDENWAELIEEAFQHKGGRLFGPREFIEISEPPFDPLCIEYPLESPMEPGAHVFRINERDLRSKEIEYALL